MSASKQEFTIGTIANHLEKFMNIPGLQHLAENIFLNLKYHDFEACRLVKVSFQLILDQLIQIAKRFDSLNVPIELRMTISSVIVSLTNVH